MQLYGFFLKRREKTTLARISFVSKRIPLNEAGPGDTVAELLWVLNLSGSGSTTRKMNIKEW
jgi:hypothetical protein